MFCCLLRLFSGFAQMTLQLLLSSSALTERCCAVSPSSRRRKAEGGLKLEKPKFRFFSELHFSASLFQKCRLQLSCQNTSAPIFLYTGTLLTCPVGDICTRGVCTKKFQTGKMSVLLIKFSRLGICQAFIKLLVF